MNDTQRRKHMLKTYGVEGIKSMLRIAQCAEDMQRRIRAERQVAYWWL